MAKKTISRLSVLAVLIVFLAACSKTSEYTNVIPADASVVASINLKSLASKAGLDDKENEAAKQKVLEALKSGMNAATFQQLEKVMKNPGESGIDVESPFYVFSSSSFPYPTVVGKVNNEDNLHASLDVMAKEQICQPISEADGYSFTTMNGGLLAFNNSTVLIVNVSGTTQTEKAKQHCKIRTFPKKGKAEKRYQLPRFYGSYPCNLSQPDKHGVTNGGESRGHHSCRRTEF